MEWARRQLQLPAAASSSSCPLGLRSFLLFLSFFCWLFASFHTYLLDICVLSDSFLSLGGCLWRSVRRCLARNPVRISSARLRMFIRRIRVLLPPRCVVGFGCSALLLPSPGLSFAGRGYLFEEVLLWESSFPSLRPLYWLPLRTRPSVGCSFDARVRIT